MSGGVNWNENPWFVENTVALLDNDFKEWWLGQEGDPPEYSPGCKKEVKEWNHYWKRCGYALIGWVGYQEYNGLYEEDIESLRFE